MLSIKFFTVMKTMVIYDKRCICAGKQYAFCNACNSWLFGKIFQCIPV